MIPGYLEVSKRGRAHRSYVIATVETKCELLTDLEYIAYFRKVLFILIFCSKFSNKQLNITKTAASFVHTSPYFQTPIS